MLETTAIEGHAVFYLSYSITASMHKYLLCICQNEVPKLISPRNKGRQKFLYIELNFMKIFMF